MALDIPLTNFKVIQIVYIFIYSSLKIQSFILLYIYILLSSANAHITILVSVVFLTFKNSIMYKFGKDLKIKRNKNVLKCLPKITFYIS